MSALHIQRHAIAQECILTIFFWLELLINLIGHSHNPYTYIGILSLIAGIGRSANLQNIPRPPRTPRISELKSQVLKPTFLN